MKTYKQPRRMALVVTLVAAIFVACAEATPLGPQSSSDLVMAMMPSEMGAVPPDLSNCPQIDVPADSKLVSHVFAVGAQIYRWNGTSWIFVAPDAKLYSDAGQNGLVGTHYAGPTWESNSGSKVVGTVL